MPDQLTQLRQALANHRSALMSPEDNSQGALRDLQGHCTDIMMALQVQDITAQQIASVNKLMQSVDESLNKLMTHFSEVPVRAATEGFSHSHLDIPFDDAADYFGSGDRQKAADVLVESVQSATDTAKNCNE
jgi:chemotaxis regulatin CheY-phosphate phosphatase CheZ